MTANEQEQLTDLFWKISDIVCVLQPELIPALDKKVVNTTGIKIVSLTDVIDMLRVSVKYTQFDLEACRRDIEKLSSIIKSNDLGNEGQGMV